MLRRCLPLPSPADVRTHSRRARARAPQIVLYDDVSLPFGCLRLKPKGGAGGHNGIADVSKNVQARNFARLRIGVGPPRVHVQKGVGGGVDLAR